MRHASKVDPDAGGERKKLGEYLLEAGLVTAQQLKEGQLKGGQLSNKGVWITGGGTGIGRAAAEMSRLAKKALPLTCLMLGGKDAYPEIYANVFGRRPKMTPPKIFQ